MANRVIKDSVWTSPSLALMSESAQLHWLRWLLMADDWGCFNADTDIIKGLVYPKMGKVTLKRIEALMAEFFEVGKLFVWSDGDRTWGYFTSWNGHQFCNATSQNSDGKQARHKRKTPEPPEKELEAFLNDKVYKKQRLSGLLEENSTVNAKYRIPNPIPNLNPKHNPNAEKWFEDFWKIYPNKKGKTKAKDLFLSTVLDIDIYNNIMLSTNNYIKQIKKDNTELKYITHGNNFMKKWQDYLEVEQQQSSGRAKYGHSKCTETNPINIIDRVCQVCRERDN